MSEYYLNYTGAQLDDAINKVRSGYILPSEIINISSNVQDMDIKNGKILNVNVPVPDNYINLADIITHTTKYAASEYTPTENTVMNNISIPVKDENGNYFKPKVFVMFHNSRIENSGTSTSQIAVTSSFTIADDAGNLLYKRTSGVYYNSTYKACSNQSGSRYFKPINTGVQGVASDFYLQKDKQYLWYAWG